MPKTDWEAVVIGLLARYEGGPKTYMLDFISKLIREHTHRTEEDLPEDGVYHVRHPQLTGSHWSIIRFVAGRIVCMLQADDSKSVLNAASWNEVRLDRDLEIGPRIDPPEEQDGD